MQRLTGVGASPGIAIGVAHVLASRVDIHERRIGLPDIDAEIAKEVGKRSIRLGSELTGKITLSREERH